MASVQAVAKRPTQPIQKGDKTPWWQSGVIYQIYVRSFCDTNGDGIGDLPGIISKLDYLAELGIDGIWLSPITVSANADWGYDVVDYYNIDPALGTMADFHQLVAEAGRRHIHILTDFVPNHTSTKHPWFQNALTGRGAKYRDFYVWADPKPDGSPPNNWKALNAGGRAWEYQETTGQYYLHNFQKQQADLNWRNPEVQQEFDKIIQFWIDQGVDGFRIDVFNMLVKDKWFRDNPPSQKDDGLDIRLVGQKPVYNTSQPELHSILKRWRKQAKGRLLLGESTLLYNARQLAAFYGQQDELELAFNLMFIHCQFSGPELRRVVEETEAALRAPDWPVWTNSNHDQSRFPTRWAKGDERKIRCGLLMLLMLKGTPVIYYGDEIGMPDVFLPPWRLKDPQGRRLWPVHAGRDRARTPMQWENHVGAGFTEVNVRPWLPWGNLSRNVTDQRKAKDSTWQFTRKLLALRRQEKDLSLGGYRIFPTDSGEVWAWQRGHKHLVAINFSNQPNYLNNVSGDIVLSTNGRRHKTLAKDRLQLKPWEGVIIRMPQAEKSN
jgi:alpha-glucosidase